MLDIDDDWYRKLIYPRALGLINNDKITKNDALSYIDMAPKTYGCVLMILAGLTEEEIMSMTLPERLTWSYLFGR